MPYVNMQHAWAAYDQQHPRETPLVILTPLNQDDVENDSEQRDWKPKREEWMIMATLSISSLVVAFDSTILVVILPTLAVDLNGTTQEAFWAGTSYLLACAVLQPFIATVSDIFGRRELLSKSILFFTLGSILCAVSDSFETFLSGRIIQGFGGGGIITLTQLIFADIVPLRQRPKFFSMVLLSWAVGTILGPVLGGIIVEKTTWGWCFGINVFVCMLAFTMADRFVRFTMPETSLKYKLLQIDWIGNLLLLSSLTSFLIGISWGGVDFSWSSWQTIAPLVLGGVGIIITILYEMFVAKKPFFDKALFHNPSSIFSYVCAMLHGIALLMALYYTAFYFTSIQGKSPISCGVSVLSALVCLLPGSAMVSVLITRLGQYRIFIWIGSAIATVGAGLFILFDIHTPKAVWVTAMAIFGLGMGMILSAVNFSVQAVVEPKHAARAASFYAFMRSVGMSLGVAIGGSVFQNCMKHELIALNLDASIAQNAEAYVADLVKMTDGAAKDALLHTYVVGFRGVWEVLTGVCAAGLVIALGVKHFNMDRLLASSSTVRNDAVGLGVLSDSNQVQDS